MKEKIFYYMCNIKSIAKFSKYYNKNNSLNNFAAELLRSTHSIEKGLSISNIRLGFGHQKQEKMIDYIDILKKENNDYYREVISMALSSLNKYIEYHDKMNYSDDFIRYLKDYLKDKDEYIDDIYGGTLEFNKKDLKFDIKSIEDFFNSRHSIRDFSNKPVDKEKIMKAIKLAQRCPSACNRQGVRTYVIEKNRAEKLIKQLSGIGGFANSLDKIIIITGKISSYRYNEANQYIVSASIYAGYLSLTLHLYGIGACVIQRPVIYSNSGETIKKEFNIDDDEQIICMIGIGNIEDKIKVPVSHRISIEEFCKYIGD